MTGQPRRVQYAPAPPARVASLLLLLLGLVLGTAGSAGAQYGGFPANFCYTWEHGNSTGQDANDLHIRLEGVQQISDAYTGSGNPFGAPTVSQYVPAIDSYALGFAGGPAPTGDTVRSGICTGHAVLRLGPATTTPPLFWSDDGATLTPAPPFVGLSWHRDAHGLVIDLHNDQSAALVIWSLNLLKAPAPLPLNDLDAENAATLSLVAVLSEDAVTLVPGETRSFPDTGSSSTPLRPGEVLVAEIQASAGDDFGNTLHLLAQAEAPVSILYLPVIYR